MRKNDSNPPVPIETTPKYQGWWRCRIKARTQSPYPWLYFEASASNKREYRREARMRGQVILRRTDFDFEQTQEPTGKLRLDHLTGFPYYRGNATGSLDHPPFDSPEVGG